MISYCSYLSIALYWVDPVMWALEYLNTYPKEFFEYLAYPSSYTHFIVSIIPRNQLYIVHMVHVFPGVAFSNLLFCTVFHTGMDCQFIEDEAISYLYYPSLGPMKLAHHTLSIVHGHVFDM